MGLTISYRGTLRNPDEVESIVEDVVDICLEIGWHFMPIHRSGIMPTQGIMITPAGSEPIWLTFLTNGKMYDPSHFIYTTRPDLEVVNEEMRKWIFTKTQYAGVYTHMAIIKFFRYLSMKYFKEFELRDQSQYWETDDESVCLVQFDEFDEVMDRMTGLLESDEDMDEEDLDDDELDDDELESDRMAEVLWRRGGMGLNLN
jgi:hypothetical protein